MAEKEKAKGDRETEPDESGTAPGITNRPLEEEQKEQRELPPRGTAKRED